MKSKEDSSTEKAFGLDDILIQLQVIFKRLRLVVLCSCVVLAIGLIYYCYARPIYRAVSSVDCVTYINPAETKGPFNNRRGWLEVKHKMARPAIFQLAAKRLDINMGYRGIRRNYINSVRIYQDKNVHDFTHNKLLVEVLSYDQEIGKRWAEALVEEFKEYRRKERGQKVRHETENARASMEDLEREIAGLEQEKISIEKKMNYSRLRMEHNILRSLPKNINTTERSIEEMEEVLSDLNVENLSIKEKFSILSRYHITNKLGKVVPQVEEQLINELKDEQNTLVITPTDTGIDKKWIKLDQAYEKLKLIYEEQSKKFGPSHPEMKELTIKLEIAQQDLKDEYLHALRSFQLNYDQMRARLEDLKDKYPRYKQVNVDISEVQRLVSDISRRANKANRKYSTLRARVEFVEKAV